MNSEKDISSQENISFDRDEESYELEVNKIPKIKVKN